MFLCKFVTMPKTEVYALNEMYKTIENLCKENGINITKMCRDTGITRGSLTDLKMGRSAVLSSKTLAKIATYFSVPIESLMITDPEVRLLNDVFSGKGAGSVNGVSGSSIVMGANGNVSSTVNNGTPTLSSLEAGILEKVRRLPLEDQVKVFNFLTELEGKGE